MKKFLLKIQSKIPVVLRIPYWILISCAFSITLLLARVITSGRVSYVFLAWNLFLAAVPFLISNWLSRHQDILAKRIKTIPLIFLWILFMPNSFYILTDLFHLQNMGNGHPWFDLTLILSFAWTGILFGISSIINMELILKKVKGRFVSGIVICAVMWLNAFGIYIGRFLRFNSWDVIINPFSLLTEIGGMIVDPYDYRYAWVMSVCFAFFMVIMYYSIKRLRDLSNHS